MTTVASRIVRSSPHRNTSSTWDFIVDLLDPVQHIDQPVRIVRRQGIAG